MKPLVRGDRRGYTAAEGGAAVRKTAEDKLVTSAELAEYLGVTRRTVKRYTKLKKIRPVRRHQFKYFWDLKATVLCLHNHGLCEDSEVPD